MDELLAVAFEETAKDIYNSRSQVPQHRFSFKFYRKMHKILRMWGTQEKDKKAGKKECILELYRPIRSKRRLALIILLLLMLLGGSSVASEPFIRWLSNFYMEQNDDHIRFQNDKNDQIEIGSRIIFRKYSFVELPEGYSMVNETFSKEFQRYFVTYSNKSQELLSLKQTWKEDESPEKLTSDKEPMKDVEISGFTGYYVEDNGIGTLVISNGVYKLVLDGPFTKEELVDLAGKLELSDDPIE